ncbi:adenine phosphoribosyltransferase [Poseidonocella sp. HB161398]|uniref:adenine phosphoribosyltransferase n=1 Tax=Poseidonocella sp. HB161398 TaxID=2320855 RepID=UPI001107F74B|nr:adenine phosphoribosyltransferase [Poseidonocella sp. HB161398]
MRDVFSTGTLRSRALRDPFIRAARISEFKPDDLVGDASSIGRVAPEAGRAGVSISPRNFEQLPDPVLFPQGVRETLRPGGFPGMAVPDCRASFEHFRMPRGWRTGRAPITGPASSPRPRPSSTMKDTRDGVAGPGCDLGKDPASGFAARRDLAEPRGRYPGRRTGGMPCRDAHFTVVFPEVLQCMPRDLRHRGLIELEVLEVTPARGLAVFVHPREPEPPVEESGEAFHARRDALLRSISEQRGAALHEPRIEARRLRRAARPMPRSGGRFRSPARGSRRIPRSGVAFRHGPEGGGRSGRGNAGHGAIAIRRDGRGDMVPVA